MFNFENVLVTVLVVTTILVALTRVEPRVLAHLATYILLGIVLAAITILMLHAMGVR